MSPTPRKSVTKKISFIEDSFSLGFLKFSMKLERKITGLRLNKIRRFFNRSVPLDPLTLDFFFRRSFKDLHDFTLNRTTGPLPYYFRIHPISFHHSTISGSLPFFLSKYLDKVLRDDSFQPIIKPMKFILLLCFLTTQAFAEVVPCGKEGSLEDRIKSCNLTKENFILVARTETGVEIYKDSKSDLIWSDRIKTDFNHYGSQKACVDESPELALFKDLKWRLPTIREFEDSAIHGMKSALPNMTYWFWTSTPLKSKSRGRRRRAPPAQSFLWDGVEQKSDVGDLKDAASVRCVAR